MANPTPETPSTEAATPRRKGGPRTFEKESYSLVLNKETGFYDLSFEGRSFPIRFVAPAALSILPNPLGTGLVHKSGRHTFRLSFKDDRLVSIINDQVAGGFSEGVEVPKTESIQVPVNSVLSEWISVIVELSVVQALRTK